MQQNRSFINGLVGLYIESLHKKMYQMKLFVNHINFKIYLLLSDDVLPRVTKK
ncbi:hypothetical protein JU54_001622 [Salmonella enterica subsp. enterica serovar Weslaco]|nr:hypothetical protein [Salmonella enterica subsp. enterica]EDW0652205.1 hypothetical protein [Salmonella enterica subsp. enterica serovar Weslaco]EDX2437118.1 hypothetical protein [Salmonella enterica subsp. enterica serovar Koenigstuhl]EEI3890529.1 hypothetical protein [Salmonella enterica]EEJ6744415.1 hypothetical protein [Salmonella enterica subsp. enterica serovar Oslo]EGI5870063.1 hypothetical protein [Salmonella enterica subsp. enterica serovar Denver]